MLLSFGAVSCFIFKEPVYRQAGLEFEILVWNLSLATLCSFYYSYLIVFSKVVRIPVLPGDNIIVDGDSNSLLRWNMEDIKCLRKRG